MRRRGLLTSNNDEDAGVERRGLPTSTGSSESSLRRPAAATLRWSGVVSHDSSVDSTAGGLGPERVLD
jgi:hypothetical protein